MKILVATHRAASFPPDGGYIPFQNGVKASPDVLGLLDDSTGENISERMPHFSECCTLYWMLNNLDDELFGLMHYRRYFAPSRHSVTIGNHTIAASNDFAELEHSDLVVTVERDLSPQTVREQYAECHFIDDLVRTRDVMARLYPAYVPAFDYVMDHSAITLYNIFVGRRAVMRHYGDWLFPILFALEGVIPFRSYGFYQERVFAFLAERLFTVWLKANERDLRIARRPMVFID